MHIFGLQTYFPSAKPPVWLVADYHQLGAAGVLSLVWTAWSVFCTFMCVTERWTARMALMKRAVLLTAKQVCLEVYTVKVYQHSCAVHSVSDTFRKEVL